MEIKKLTAELAVSQQIAASDLRAIADAGFRAVVCNRAMGPTCWWPVVARIRGSVFMSNSRSDCVEGNLEIRHSVIFRIGHMSGAHVDLH